MMHLHKTMLALVIIVCGYFVSSVVFAKTEEDAKWVSIINLVATPERYHKKKIFVTGLFRVRQEDISLCLTRNPVSTKECIWVELKDLSTAKSIDKETYQQKFEYFKKYDNKVISVHGLFDMKDTGHLGGWSGGIHSITKITAVPLTKNKNSH